MNDPLLTAIEKLDEGTAKTVHLTPQEAAALLARLKSHTVRPGPVVKGMERKKRLVAVKEA